MGRHCMDPVGCATLRPATRRWHEAYCRWFDHDRAGHRVRAAAWGW